MKRIVSCHCGAVKLAVVPSEPLTDANRCDCSFCRRRAAATVSVAPNNLEILQGAENLTLYQWNTQTAIHYFCKTCGIYTHHKRRAAPHDFGVNLGAFEDITHDELRAPGWTDGVNHPSDK